MKTKKAKYYFFSQNGVGLIPAVLASALVVLLAFIISFFVTKQRQVSVQLDNSIECQQTLKSATDFLTKDNNALFISSVGPQDLNMTPGNLEFFPSRFLTQDGFPQFPANITANVGVNSAVNAPPPPSPTQYNNSNAAILPNWDFRNSLNIRNTINRMAALAMANPAACCNDLDEMSANRPGNLACGIAFNPPNVDMGSGQVIIGVNFSDSLGNNFCPTQNRFPTSRNNATAKIRVQVFMDQNAQNPKSCTGDATAHFADDQVSPLVLLDIPNTGMCADGLAGAPYTCNPAATNFTFTARTVRNANVQSCEQCLANNLNSNQCPGPQNPAAVCAAACADSDPGSTFLCRIGEKHWFDMNPNHWEPCERTAVYGCSGGQWIADGGLAVNTMQSCTGRVVLGRVNINYLDNTALPNFPNQTSTTTRATITLSNLTQSRAYEIDIRAVDTKGNFAGRSFVGVVSTGANGRSYLSGPQLVVPTEPPVLGALTEDSFVVQNAGSAMGATPIPNPAAYNPMVGQYQCIAGSPSFSAPIERYASQPPHVYPYLYGEDCTLNVNGPSGVLNGTCQCSNGFCTGTVPAVSNPGNWNAQMDVTSKCGQAGNQSSFGWCFENTSNPIASISVGNTASDTPSLSLTRPATKLCDLSVGLGNVVPALVNYRLFNTPLNEPFTTMGWNPLIHSGCQSGWFIYPQICTTVTDVCGRQSRPRMDYSSRLTVGDGTTNSCEFVGYNTDGNDCVNGAYCKNNFKCEARINHPNAGQDCFASESGSVPYNDINTPCAHTTDCKFGKIGYMPGTCQGAQYECVSTSPVASEDNCSSGPVAGRACEINNTCQNMRRVCFDANTNAPKSPYQDCNTFLDCRVPPDNSSYCGVLPESGNCKYNLSEKCDDVKTCSNISGTCQVKTPGKCQAPMNLHCDECPQSGSRLLCPLIDGGCDLLPLPSFPIQSCAAGSPPPPPPPPPPACGTCVRGDEVSRSRCLKPDGTEAALGEAGTITVTYSGCRCDISGAPCGGCATTEAIACTGTLEMGRWCHVGDDQRCVADNRSRTVGSVCNPRNERNGFENDSDCPNTLRGKELLCVANSLPCPPYAGPVCRWSGPNVNPLAPNSAGICSEASQDPRVTPGLLPVAGTICDMGDRRVVDCRAADANDNVEFIMDCDCN